jgi:hypothetical protein
MNHAKVRIRNISTILFLKRLMTTYDAAPLTSSTLTPPPNGTLGTPTGEQRRPSATTINISHAKDEREEIV